MSNVDQYVIKNWWLKCVIITALFVYPYYKVMAEEQQANAESILNNDETMGFGTLDYIGEGMLTINDTGFALVTQTRLYDEKGIPTGIRKFRVGMYVNYKYRIPTHEILELKKVNPEDLDFEHDTLPPATLKQPELKSDDKIINEDGVWRN